MATGPKKSVATKQFQGDLMVWRSLGKGQDRRFTTLALPFGEIRQWFHVLPYDSLKNTGWQRGETPSHAKNLQKAYVNGNYTPTPITGGLLPYHAKSLQFPEGEEHGKPVVITVSTTHKLPLIDGGHRRAGLEMERAKAVAEGDQDRVDLIDEQPFTITVHLDSNFLQKDFLNSQLGRAVDRNTIRSMELAGGNVDPAKRPYLEMANAVLRILHKDQSSYLYGQVKFDSGGVGPLDMNTLTTTTASAASYTLYGGSQIAIKYGQDANWLAGCYNFVFQAIREHGPRDDDGGPLLFQGRRMLTPTLMAGTRMGSKLLMGLGNCLAFRCAYEDRKPEKDDVERIVEVCADFFDKPVVGGAGDDMRREIGGFAKQYFSDMEVAKVDGVPLDLLRIISASSWKVDAAEAKDAIKKADNPAPTLGGGIEDLMGE